MRITQQMMANSVISNLQNDYQALQTSQNQLDTGLAVNQPSDNPLATNQIMELNTNISMQGVYYGNMQTASSELSMTSSALSDMMSNLQQIRTLAVEASNGTQSTGDLRNLEQEVNQFIENLVQVGNTTDGTANYIFGGTQTNVAPLQETTSTVSGITSVSNVTFTGDDGQINYEITQGVKVPANVAGSNLFQISTPTSGGNTTMFNALIALKNHMLSGNSSACSLSGLSSIDGIISNIEDQQAMVGTIQDRLTEAMTRNQNDKTSMTTTLANLQDVDVASATVTYDERSNVYQAALEAAAKAITPTLAEYLTNT